jgi:hypothetical protein
MRARSERRCESLARDVKSVTFAIVPGGGPDELHTAFIVVGTRSEFAVRL